MACAEPSRVAEYFTSEKAKECLDDVAVNSSIMLSPDSTPTKDALVRSTMVDVQENDSRLDDKSMDNLTKKATLARSQSDSRLDSPKPPKSKITRSEINSKCVLEDKFPKPDKNHCGKGRSGRAKKETIKFKQTDVPLEDKPKQEKEPQKMSSQKSKPVPRSKSVSNIQNIPDKSNKLLTDFFPVRRSNRMTSRNLKKKNQLELEEKILSGCEDGLKVVDIVGKGRGVISTKVFKRGDFVVEYIGDLVDTAQAKERDQEYSADPDLGCYMYYFNFQNRRFCVDATSETGKLGRLLNHSKLNGNCMTKVVGIDNKPYLILVAARDIEVGEELLYDYGDRSKEALEAHPWLAL